MTDLSQKELWQIYIAAAQKQQTTSDPKETEKNLRQAIAGLEQARDSRVGLLVDAKSALANMLRNQGRLEEAGQLYDKALCLLDESNGSRTAASMAVLDRKADLYCELGDFEKAKENKRESLDILLGLEDPNSLAVATAQSELANIVMILRDYNEAARLYEKSLASMEAAGCASDEYCQSAYAQLATVYYMLSRFDKTETYIRKAIQLNQQSTSGCEERYLSNLSLLGLTLCAQGKQHEAQSHCRQALTLGQSMDNQPESSNCLSQLADVYCEQERFDEAATLCKEAFWQREEGLGSPRPDLKSDLKAYLFLLRQSGRLEEASRIEKRLRCLTEEIA
ncbi:MAG: tetratricopeptide repeat protein [Candidatus Obscuribacterales bacterium]|nr:tetratricopeptide repeat protein [Candidatus Obscuribacterales bacterium]